MLTQHQMERLTDKELLDKHRTFRCNKYSLSTQNDTTFMVIIITMIIMVRLNTEVSMDATRTWCPSAGCDTICHICAGTKSQVIKSF